MQRHHQFRFGFGQLALLDQFIEIGTKLHHLTGTSVQTRIRVSIFQLK
ncbi:Uncharacterised protein [Vibrio cholerae]|nr:Uncharacterised protein [Vibrio cholerae]